MNAAQHLLEVACNRELEQAAKDLYVRKRGYKFLRICKLGIGICPRELTCRYVHRPVSDKSKVLNKESNSHNTSGSRLCVPMGGKNLKKLMVEQQPCEAADVAVGEGTTTREAVEDSGVTGQRQTVELDCSKL